MTPPTIKAIRVIDDRLIFELDEDREVSLPISASACLAKATLAEREHWTIGPRGISVHRPDVDEDIAIWEVLAIAEDAYLRSLRETPASRRDGDWAVIGRIGAVPGECLRCDVGSRYP